MRSWFAGSDCMVEVRREALVLGRMPMGIELLLTVEAIEGAMLEWRGLVECALIGEVGVTLGWITVRSLVVLWVLEVSRATWGDRW
jgi:hypothetical protein